MAPEVLDSEEKMTKYNNKCDLWSLGVTIHEIMFKKFLVKNVNNKIEAKNPKQTWDKCQPELSKWVKVCSELLLTDPKVRVSAEEFVKKIAEIDN